LYLEEFHTGQPVTGQVFDIKKFAIHDGPGIRTTVFLTGCPLACWWCHNPECNLPNGQDTKQSAKKMTVRQVMTEIEKDFLFYDESGGGVTFSGGEPMLQPEFLEQMLENCRNRGIQTAVDTSGQVEWDDIERIGPLTDLWLYDLKLIDPNQHLEYTGITNSLIVDNLTRIVDNGWNVRIRVPLIPGYTDTVENLEALAAFVHGLPVQPPVDLLPFNLFYSSKYERLKIENKLGKLTSHTPDQLAACKAIFETQSLEVKV
jgi:pyruvate formate lyase activating enzyme